jgi:hypothetical protein
VVHSRVISQTAAAWIHIPNHIPTALSTCSHHAVTTLCVGKLLNPPSHLKSTSAFHLFATSPSMESQRPSPHCPFPWYVSSPLSPPPTSPNSPSGSAQRITHPHCPLPGCHPLLPPICSFQSLHVHPHYFSQVCPVLQSPTLSMPHALRHCISPLCLYTPFHSSLTVGSRRCTDLFKEGTCM